MSVNAALRVAFSSNAHETVTDPSVHCSTRSPVVLGACELAAVLADVVFCFRILPSHVLNLARGTVRAGWAAPLRKGRPAEQRSE